MIVWEFTELGFISRNHENHQLLPSLISKDEIQIMESTSLGETPGHIRLTPALGGGASHPPESCPLPSKKPFCFFSCSRSDDPAHVGAPPHFGDTPIRALYGLRLPIFPVPEGIIPENGGIIHPASPVLTPERQRSYLATFCGRNGG